MKVLLGDGREGHPRRRRFNTVELARHAGMLFTMGVLVLGYSFMFQLTKPSPLSRGSLRELIEVGAYIILLAAALAVLGASLTMAFELLVRLKWPEVRRGLFPLAAVGVLAFLGLLGFTQNLAYTATNWGLNRGDDISTKLIFGVFAGAGAGLATLRLGRTGNRLWSAAAISAVTLSVPALGIAAAHILSAPKLSPLVESSSALPLNVVILSSDAVEAEHLSAYGYERSTTPFLDTHIHEFMKFENAFTNNGNTTGSITSVLTGRSPLETRVVYPPDQLDVADAQLSLPLLLAEVGYRTENWSVPHYADARDQNLVRAFDLDNGEKQRGAFFSGWPAGVGLPGWFVRDTVRTSRDLLLDVVGIREMKNPYSAVGSIVGNTITDDQRIAGMKKTIDRDAPFFINSHLMETHGPAYRLDDPHFSRGQSQTEPWEADFYDDSLRGFDQRVRQVYDALASAGKLDRTLFIVTSDHGIDYDTTRRVPLLIRLPGADKAGSYVPNVERVDIAPTVLDALGYEPPIWMTGSSLLDPEDLQNDREILAASSSKRQFDHNQGFHAGASVVDVSAVRCRWFVVREADGTYRTGEVEGSTATCTERPQVPSPF